MIGSGEDSRNLIQQMFTEPGTAWVLKLQPGLSKSLPSRDV